MNPNSELRSVTHALEEFSCTAWEELHPCITLIDILMWNPECFNFIAQHIHLTEEEAQKFMQELRNAKDFIKCNF